jgi:hypothetical protein
MSWVSAVVGRHGRHGLIVYGGARSAALPWYAVRSVRQRDGECVIIKPARRMRNYHDAF